MRSQCWGMSPGGKGLNQAVALRRLGVSCTLIGAVGDDEMGHILLRAMESEQLTTDAITCVTGRPSGIAVPILREDGSNVILVDPGANIEWTVEDLSRHIGSLRSCQVLLIQLEVSQEVSIAAAKIVRQNGGLVVLDPAPYAPISDELWKWVDIVTPNADELSRILAVEPITSLSKGLDAATCLHDRHHHLFATVATLGSFGVAVSSHSDRFTVPAESIIAVDETAAGDAFNAGLALRLMSGDSLHDAVVFANHMGALAASRPGSLKSLPQLTDVD